MIARGKSTLLLSLLALTAVLALARVRPLLLDETFAVRAHLTHTLPSRSYPAENLSRALVDS